MIGLIIKGAPMPFRVAMDSTEGLLALTCHVTEHELLLTPIELTKGHSRKDFKGKHI